MPLSFAPGPQVAAPQGGGLLELDNPMLDIGLGLLAASGPSLEPMGPGSALGRGLLHAQNRSQERMKNEIMRAKLAEDVAKRGAVARLRESIPGLLGEGVDPRQAELVGLLAEAAPEQVTQGIIGNIFQNDRAAPEIVRRAQFIYPDNPVKQREFVMAQGGADTVKQFDLLLKGLQIQKLQDELRQAGEDRTAKKTQLVTALRGDLNASLELADLTDRLEGTALETGLPVSEVRKMWTSIAGVAPEGIAKMFNIDVAKARQVKADFDRFSKLSMDYGVKSATRLFESGNLTNQQFQGVLDASVSPSVAPDANRLVIADGIERALAGADAAGIEIAGRKKYEDLLRKLRTPREPASTTPPPSKGGPSLGQRVQDTAQGAVDRVRGGADATAKAAGEIVKMTRSQLEALDLKRLSVEELKAAEQRWNALAGGR